MSWDQIYVSHHLLQYLEDIWRFPEMGVPKTIHFSKIFHEINHPSWGASNDISPVLFLGGVEGRHNYQTHLQFPVLQWQSWFITIIPKGYERLSDISQTIANKNCTHTSKKERKKAQRCFAPPIASSFVLHRAAHVARQTESGPSWREQISMKEIPAW